MRRRQQRAGREREAGLQDRVVPHAGEEEDVAEQQRRRSRRRTAASRARRARTPARAAARARRPAPGGARSARRNDRAEDRGRRRRRRSTRSSQPQSRALGEPERRAAPTAATSTAIPSRSGEPRGARVADLGREPQREHDRDQPERDVDEEDPAASSTSTSSPPSGGRDRGADRADAGPRADRRVERFSGGNIGSRSPSEVGVSARRADAPGARARPRAPRPTARSRTAREPSVNSASPITNSRRRPYEVAEPPGRDEQGGEHDRVGVEHPRQPGEAGAAGSRPAGPGTRC